jgi:membrane protease YdiL (CAAX protease family)
MILTKVAQNNSDMQLNTSPRIIEIVGMFLITFYMSFLFFNIGDSFISDKYGSLVSIVSHIPMLLIPWLWIHLRLRASSSNVNIWKWTTGSLKPLLLICSWLIPLQVIGNLDIIGKPMPLWYQNGATSIIIEVIFQGFFVGLTEEMFMRPAIHQALLSKKLGGYQLFKRWYISNSILITALMFGMLHVVNIGHQPIELTIIMFLYSFVIGIIFGFYYERTNNYIGTLILHSLLDVVGTFVVLFVALLT